MKKLAPPIFPQAWTKEDYKKRNRAMRRLRRQRYTHQEIANLYGISRQRVVQICEGVEPRKKLK